MVNSTSGGFQCGRFGERSPHALGGWLWDWSLGVLGELCSRERGTLDLGPVAGRGRPGLETLSFLAGAWERMGLRVGGRMRESCKVTI